MKGFISFARADARAMVAFRRAFVGQRLDIWDYSSPGQEIPLGADLRKALASEIRAADFFVVLLSRSSIANANCIFEVEQALLREDLPKFVINVDLDPDWKLGGPFESFGSHIFHDAREHWRAQEFIRNLCGALRVPYASPFAADPRLPLASRFAEEMTEVLHADQRREIGTHAKLEVWVQRFEREYAHAEEPKDFAACADVLGALLLELRADFPKHDPYYPALIRVSCCLLSGDIEAGRKGLEQLSGHARRDEHFESVNIYFLNREGRYGEAWRTAMNALSLKPTAVDFYYAAVDNLLLDSSDPLNKQLAVSLLDSIRSLEKESRRAWTQSSILLARLAATTGDTREAERAFLNALDHLPEIGTVLEFVGFLRETNQMVRAYTWLTEHPQFMEESADVAITFAYFAASVGKVETAEATLKDAIKRLTGLPTERLARRHLAQLMCALRRKAEAGQALRPLLDFRKYPLASSEDALAAAAAFVLDGQRKEGQNLLQVWKIDESELAWIR